MCDALSELTERDRSVLALQFGLLNGHARTLREVGTEFGISYERARQLAAAALQRLRALDSVRRLDVYLR